MLVKWISQKEGVSRSQPLVMLRNHFLIVFCPSNSLKKCNHLFYAHIPEHLVPESVAFYLHP